MERFTLDFSFPNFITIGLFAALWFIVIVGGYSVLSGSGGSSNSSTVAAG